MSVAPGGTPSPRRSDPRELDPGRDRARARRALPGRSIVHVRDCLPPGSLTTATMRLIAATATTVVANSRVHGALGAKRRAERPRRGRPQPGRPRALGSRAHRSRPRRAPRLGDAGERALLLGVVAQLSPWKGQDTAIEALRLLREQGIDAHLLLIGSAKFVARSTRFDNEAYVAGLRALVAAPASRTASPGWASARTCPSSCAPSTCCCCPPGRSRSGGR